MGLSFLILYITLNTNYWVAAYMKGYYTKAVTYTVAGFSWLMISMFDGELMRGIHADIVYLTVIGAFALQWIDLTRFIFAYDGSFGAGMFWLGLLIYFVVTVVEQIIQITLVPKINRWAESADILENDGSQSSRLFAV